MSFGKSSTLTSVPLAANGHNAQKSAGPHMAWGKAQSRMNSLRRPISSWTGQGGSRTAPTCLPGAVDRMARVTLTPEQATHPLLAETVDMFREAEIAVVEHFSLYGPTNARLNCRAGRRPAWAERRSALRYAKGILFSYVRSRNVIENKCSRTSYPNDFMKIKELFKNAYELLIMQEIA